MADNPALSAASGIDVERVIRIVWIGGAALAGLAGVLLGLAQGFNYQMGFKILLLIFAAVTLGGLGTIWGAIVGASSSACSSECPRSWIPAELKNVGALVILIVVLLVRPQGILGRPAGRLREGGRHGLGTHPHRLPRGVVGPQAVVFCLAAIGLNVHFGYTGLLNFGQAGFMVVAGYAPRRHASTDLRPAAVARHRRRPGR